MIGYIEEIRFVGEDGAPPVPVPPSLVSATILSDGVTLRLVFTSPIIAGDAEDGLSRSVGTITSGAVVGGNVDLTIPLVYAGDSVGTISYDANTGSLAGAGGFVESFGPLAITNDSEQVWTPASLPGIVDYGIWSDLSRLKQNSDGSGAVANVDDPVGWWRGQLDVLTLTQANTPNKLTAKANGIYIGTSNKCLFTSVTARSSGLPITLALAEEVLSTGSPNHTHFVMTQGAPQVASENVIRHGVYQQSTVHRYALNSSTRNGEASSGLTNNDTGKRRHIITASTGVAKSWTNGVGPTNRTNGGAGNNYDYVVIGAYLFGRNSLANAHLWLVCEQEISDADADLLEAYMEALQP
jgi:hypothetical protein